MRIKISERKYDRIFFARIMGLSSCIAFLLIGCSNAYDIPVQEKTKSNLVPVVDNVSGEYYDWTVTGKPERPYINDYTQCMMMKFFMAAADGKGGPSTVKMTYDEALDNIKKIDAVTRGVKKIVYLVGWNNTGHEDSYPAFNEFNEALKREGDVTARDSYFWFKNEAAKYNTLVSVHININDAYAVSPYWHTYYKNDLLCKNDDGSLYYMASVDRYKVNLVNEWKYGYLQKRIDEVSKLLDLPSVGTVHIDVFDPQISPYHGVTMEDANVVLRKVLRYWRDKGVDVTHEDLWGSKNDRTDAFWGLSPAVWWNNLSEDDHVRIRPELMAGGRCGDVFGNLYNDRGFLFGDNMQAENLLRRKQGFAEFAKQFCETSLQYFFLNKHKLEKYDKSNKIAYYSDNVVVSWNDRSVKQNGRLLRQNDDILMPAVWITDHKELIAFSQSGYQNRTWTLPTDWEGVTQVAVYPITEKGLGEEKTYAVTNGKLVLSLSAGDMYSLQIK